MPFISNEDYEKQEQQYERKEKLEKRVEQMKITDEAKNKQEATKDKSMSEKDMWKALYRAPKTKPPKEPTVSITDVKKEIQFIQLLQKEQENQVQDLLNDTEICEIKQEVINVMAMPHRDPRKGG
jgi:hypothetical protein